MNSTLTIPQLKASLAQTRGAVGALGEALAIRALEAAGYHVKATHETGDLTVINPDGQILSVEVKTARRGHDGIYRFTLYKRWQGRVCADHRNSDVVLLLCVLRTGDVVPFVVPSADLKNRKSAQISSYPWDYRGWLSTYRQEIKNLRIERGQS